MDWGEITIGEYLETVEAHNRSANPDATKPASPEFVDFMRRQFKQG